MKKRKFNRKSGGNLLLGALFNVVTLIFVLVIFSLVLSLLKNPIAFLSIAGIAAYLSCGGISAFVNSKRKGEGGFVFALLSSLIASGVFFAVGIIASGGKAALSLLMNILCYLLVSALFARLAMLKKKKYKRH